jgi:hypothetical protein
MRRDPHRLVFIDKTGTTTKMTRPRGRCPKGATPALQSPVRPMEDTDLHRRPALLWAYHPFVVGAPLTRDIFETHVETQLAPTLSKGVVVIMDNLPAHIPRSGALVAAFATTHLFRRRAG